MPAAPPPDVRATIVKMAELVAKNGPHIEELTLNKQRGNPAMAFLFPGGAFHDVYRCAGGLSLRACGRA